MFIKFAISRRMTMTVADAITARTGSLSDGTAAVQPAVSVVIACFNGGRFLDGLMASLDAQTFRDFEIVIVDDGSTDELTVGKLAALDDRARVIRQPNRGPAAARNMGIRAARADIVFNLDCDDTIEPSYLAETVSALQAAPPGVGMVVTDSRFVGADSGVLPRYFNRFDLLFTNTLSTGLVMRKESWRAAGGYDETMRDGFEDWEFSLRLARAGFRGIEIAKPLYIYRVAGDDDASSISSSIQRRHLYAKLWREIRCRHPESYRLPAMIKTWLQSRDGKGRVSLVKGLAGYLLAMALPDDAFNGLFEKLHRRRTTQRAAAA
jgi:glycosyltransferase involved in cell wall biosynthesis